jgi:hypothetical protein
MKRTLAVLLVLVVSVFAAMTSTDLRQLKGLRAVTVKVGLRLGRPDSVLVQYAGERGLNGSALGPRMTSILQDSGMTVPDSSPNAVLRLDVLLDCVDSNRVLGYLKLALIQRARLNRDSSPAFAEVVVGERVTDSGTAPDRTASLVKDVESFAVEQTGAFVQYWRYANKKKK